MCRFNSRIRSWRTGWLFKVNSAVEIRTTPDKMKAFR
jgi:hypothetical protein